jgi:hypothetical protein
MCEIPIFDPSEAIGVYGFEFDNVEELKLETD